MTRTDEILKLIVEHFIKTAEPVGSKTLQEKYSLKVSSATIRNEMKLLEDEGLIEKPFTSAGRVPSEKGYRYYIENLRSGAVDENAKNALSIILSEKSKSVEQVLEESCEILSSMTSLASVVLGQKTQEEKLVSIQIIPLTGRMATAVFVTDQGYVENKTFVIEETLHVEEVVRTVKLLNDRLAGTPIYRLCDKMESLRLALQDYLVGQEIIFDAIMGAFAKLTTERVASYGKDELFKQPEFANDALKIRKLIGLLDDPIRLKEALAKGISIASGVSVRIGDKKEGTDSIAMVSADLALPGEPNTALTLVGPARMDYDKVVATLQYFAKALEDYFQTGERKDKDNVE